MCDYSAVLNVPNTQPTWTLSRYETELTDRMTNLRDEPGGFRLGTHVDPEKP